MSAPAGSMVSNDVTVPVGNNGSIRIYNQAGTVNLTADLTGYTTG